MRRFAQKHFIETNIFGWVKSIHKLKNKTFIKVQDGRSSENIQVVLNNDMVNNNLKRGNCVNIFGNLVESIGKRQNIELNAVRYEVLSNRLEETNSNDVDIDTNDRLLSSLHSGLRPEVARNDLLHLRHRLDYFAALSRIRAGVKGVIRSYMQQIQYLEVDPPYLTNIDCECAGEIFHVVISNEKEKKLSPKLSVSCQLHLEALVLGLSQVYSMGPVFRANKSGTRHHLAEFIMLEAESVLLTDVDCICAEIELLVRHVTQWMIEKQSANMKAISRSNIVSSSANRLDYLSDVLRKGFTKITYEEAMHKLQQEGILEAGVRVDMSKKMEQQLVEIMGGGAIFVTDFPATLKPFYCKTEGERSLSVDLLLPDVGEVAGGSVREDDYGRMRNRILEVGIDENEMRWYLDLRRGGGCPHGGYGLGLDRLIQFLTGVQHIQDVVPFPRTYDDCLL